MKKFVKSDIINDGIILKGEKQIHHFFEAFNKVVEPKDFVSEQNIDLFNIDLENDVFEKVAVEDLIVRTFDDFITELYDIVDSDVDNIREHFEYADTPNLAETMFTDKQFTILKKLLSAKYLTTVLSMGPIKRIIKLNSK